MLFIYLFIYLFAISDSQRHFSNQLVHLGQIFLAPFRPACCSRWRRAALGDDVGLSCLRRLGSLIAPRTDIILISVDSQLPPPCIIGSTSPISNGSVWLPRACVRTNLRSVILHAFQQGQQGQTHISVMNQSAPLIAELTPLGQGGV